MNSLNRSEPCPRQDFAFSFAVNCPAPEWEIMSYFITKPGNSNQESMRLQKVYLLRVGNGAQGHKASKALPYFLCFSQLFHFRLSSHKVFTNIRRGSYETQVLRWSQPKILLNTDFSKDLLKNFTSNHSIFILGRWNDNSYF